MSCVKCQVPNFKCHVSGDVVELVGGGSVIVGATSSSLLIFTSPLSKLVMTNRILSIQRFNSQIYFLEEHRSKEYGNFFSILSTFTHPPSEINHSYIHFIACQVSIKILVVL